MVGDQADVSSRLKRVLAPWFGNGPTPILDSLLQGPAWALAFIYSLYAYAKLQTRISTAVDGWLDLIAFDYFGPTIARRAGQSDVSFRAIIKANLLRIRVTRPAMAKVLTDVTGVAPVIAEPQRVYDGCAYSAYGGYNVGLAYGSTQLPWQCFVTAFRPVAGSLQDGVTDADIIAAIEAVRPVTMKVWVRIVGGSGGGILDFSDPDNSGLLPAL